MADNLPPSLTLSQLQGASKDLASQGAPQQVVQSFVDNYQTTDNQNYTLKGSQPTQPISPPLTGNHPFSEDANGNFNNPTTPLGNAIGNTATSNVPSIPAPFKSSPNDTALENTGKTLGNMATDTVNLGSGIVNFLNPFKNVKSIIDNVSQTYQSLQDYSKQTGESPWSVLGHAFTDPNSGDAAVSAFVPKFLQQIFSGDTAGAQKTLAENPVTSIAPMLLVASGAADKMGMGDQFNSAMKTIASPVTGPLGDAGDAIKQSVSNVKNAVGTKLTNVANKTAQTDWEKPGTQSKPGYGDAKGILENAKTNNNNIGERLVNNGIKLSDNITGKNYDTSESANKLRQDTIKASNETLRPALKAADPGVERTMVADVLKTAKDNIDANKDITAERKITLKNNIDKAQTALEAKYKNGMSLEDLHNEKILRDSNVKYDNVTNNPATNNEALKNKAIADASRTTLEKNAPQGIPVKEVNAEFANNFQAADYLDAINKKAVPQSVVGRIARGAIQGGSAMVGSSLGIGGAFGGYTLGGVLENMLRNVPTGLRDSLLSNVKTANPEAFNNLSDFIKQSATDQTNRLALPSPGDTVQRPIITSPPSENPLNSKGINAVKIGKESISQQPFKGTTEAQWKEVVDGIHKEINDSIKRNTNQPNASDVTGTQKNLPPLNSIMKEGTLPNSSLIKSLPDQAGSVKSSLVGNAKIPSNYDGMLKEIQNRSGVKNADMEQIAHDATLQKEGGVSDKKISDWINKQLKK